MAKVYGKKYTNSGPTSALPAIVVPNGKLASVAIPFASEGYIDKLVVKQVAGTNRAAVVELLDSVVPYPVGTTAAVATAAADPVELYRIIPQQAVSSGVALELDSTELGYSFANADGNPTKNQRLIYLVIKPTSSVDDTTWDVAIMGRIEAGV